MATTTPYSTTTPFIAAGKMPTWIPDLYDQARVASYGLYDDMYRSNPDTFSLMLRGSDEKPIYVPTAKRLVNTIARYVGKGFAVSVSRAVGTAAEQEAAIVAFGNLVKRERILTKFRTGKREMLIRGDWFWLLLADPDKAEGSRISVKCVDPRTVFPIASDEDPDRIVGYDIVEQVVVGQDTYVERQRWVKPTSPLHPNFSDDETSTTPIAYERLRLDMKDWQSENAVVVATEQPMTLLDPAITQLPVYHIKNGEETGNPFGYSELAGLERVIAGINQGITDQDLALSMAGLGIYMTDAGAPVDAEGNDTDWILGPKRVVEVKKDSKFERVSGIASTDPSISHLDWLKQSIDETAGVSDAALGSVDVAVATSGVALKLRFAPLLDAAEEKDGAIKEVMDQMLFDLRSWFGAYEGVSMPNVEVLCVFGNKLPRDTDKEFEVLNGLHLDGVITTEVFLEKLKDLGFEFPTDMVSPITAARAEQDRAAQELAGGEGATPDDESLGDLPDVGA